MYRLGRSQNAVQVKGCFRLIMVETSQVNGSAFCIVLFFRQILIRIQWFSYQTFVQLQSSEGILYQLRNNTQLTTDFFCQTAVRQKNMAVIHGFL